MSDEQPIEHTIICIPTEHWDMLETTLFMDSQSSANEPAIREDITNALDELEQSMLPSRIVEMLPKSILDGDTRFPDYNGACTLGEVLNALFGDVQDLLDSIHWVEGDRNGLATLHIDREVAEDFKALYGRQEDSQ
jgi:hypothetical protein